MRFWLLFLASVWTAFGAEFPELVVPETSGVNIHFTTGHQQDLDMIAAAGFKFIRMDMTWEATEQKRGEYDWSEYDGLAKNLKQRGLRAIFILDYSNGLYEPDVDSLHPFTHEKERRPGSPQHPEGIAAYAKWAAAAAKHFRHYDVIWEIYNEPNGLFWKPKADVEQYIRLALAASKAIRAANKHATVIAPATSGLPFDFLEPFLKSGVLRYIDGVSVHPYRGEAPETAANDYKRLRELINIHAPESGKKNVPILSGEWGYSSHAGGYSPELQAAYLVRQQLFNLSQGIPISIWYDWKNDGLDEKEPEQNFGTVTYELQPKPAYVAMQQMTRELSGFKFVETLPTASGDDFALLFQNRQRTKKIAVWTTGKPHNLALAGQTYHLSTTPAILPAR